MAKDSKQINFSPINNLVLVRPAYDNDVVNVEGFKAKIDATYDIGEHQPVHGVVVKVPERLCFDEFQTLDYLTDMELEVGDEVVCQFDDVYNAMNESEQRWVDVDGEVLLLIRYDRILVARRGKEIIPLNGFVLCSPLPEEEELFKLQKKGHSQYFAKVEYIGRNVDFYRYPPFFDDYEFPDLKNGDIIMFDRASDIKIEHDLHRKFFTKPMFRIHRRDILAVP